MFKSKRSLILTVITFLSVLVVSMSLFVAISQLNVKDVGANSNSKSAICVDFKDILGVGGVMFRENGYYFTNKSKYYDPIDIFRIKTVEELYIFKEIVNCGDADFANKTVELVKTIENNGIFDYGGEYSVDDLTIGERRMLDHRAFAGKFDGGGCTITNFRSINSFVDVTYLGHSYVCLASGLFTAVKNGVEIRNLKLKDYTVHTKYYDSVIDTKKSLVVVLLVMQRDKLL